MTMENFIKSPPSLNIETNSKKEEELIFDKIRDENNNQDYKVKKNPLESVPPSKVRKLHFVSRI